MLSSQSYPVLVCFYHNLFISSLSYSIDYVPCTSPLTCFFSIYDPYGILSGTPFKDLSSVRSLVSSWAMCRPQVLAYQMLSNANSSSQPWCFPMFAMYVRSSGWSSKFLSSFLAFLLREHYWKLKMWYWA